MENETQKTENKRVPPNSLRAEQMVLGAMMLDATCVLQGVDMMSSKVFYLPAHQKIFAVILELFQEEKTVDMITVCVKLNEKKILEKVGGEEYLAGLTEGIPTTSNFEYYSEIILKYYKRRVYMEAGKIFYNKAFDLDNESYIEDCDKLMLEISQSGNKSEFISIFDGLKKTVEELDALAKHGGGLAGIDTGFAELNDLTSGFMGGELIIIAARPAIGKTALALNIVETVSSKIWNTPKNKKSEKPILNAVAVFSLEMSVTELLKRMLSSHGYVDGQNIKSGALTSKDMQGLYQSVQFFKDKEIFINETIDLSPTQIRSQCRRLKMEKPNLSLIVIDYLQLMGSKNRHSSRENEVAYISRRMKALALELNIPVVVLSQLNRDGMKGLAKGGIPGKPSLDQLRESVYPKIFEI